MERYIDMHCHILPNVDDGSKDIEETRKMLQTAFDEGIRYMIATPHYHPHRGHASLKSLNEVIKQVREEAKKIDEKLCIYLGAEVFFGQDISEKLAAGEIATMNGKAVVLLEFSPMDHFDYICQGIQQIQMAGYEVIVAHVERYQCLLEDIGKAEYINKNIRRCYFS